MNTFTDWAERRRIAREESLRAYWAEGVSPEDADEHVEYMRRTTYIGQAASVTSALEAATAALLDGWIGAMQKAGLIR